ncbi:MAG TPA: thiamine diphosphokinase [Candidatus Limnocylindrales bacterium]|nr:thiamine diphosphokinase [Candidatus Limnocylindrales bacterium]
MTSPLVRAIVVADGAHPTRAALDAAWPDWDAGTDLVVAADGGARLADALGLPIHRWVGDGDSLGETGLAELRRRGVPIELASPDKDESDTELGLLTAVGAGARRVTIIGALGGLRPDHALANVALLGHPAAAGCELQILDPIARIRLLDGASGRLDLAGRVGDLVSLIPLEAVDGVTTTGLRFPLRDDTLIVGPARGISNIRAASDASVSIRSGRLLVIEAPATLRP